MIIHEDGLKVVESHSRDCLGHIMNPNLTKNVTIIKSRATGCSIPAKFMPTDLLHWF